MKIIECPRDAMQGIPTFIPTKDKVAYVNQLLKVGFDTLDMGSFVSAKAIPQMADTQQVLQEIDRGSSKSQLLVIVANVRGAAEAAAFSGVDAIGFPLSISETFQQLNTNKSITEALNQLEQIKNLCEGANKKLVTYISMGFGNPYGDPYSMDMVLKFVDLLVTMGADVVSLADTVGVASPEAIKILVATILQDWPDLELGAHLHSHPSTALQKIRAAYEGGAKRIDGALMGFGGCPMANEELVGNIPTEKVVAFLGEHAKVDSINPEELVKALLMAQKIFPK